MTNMTINKMISMTIMNRMINMTINSMISMTTIMTSMTRRKENYTTNTFLTP